MRLSGVGAESRKGLTANDMYAQIVFAKKNSFPTNSWYGASVGFTSSSLPVLVSAAIGVGVEV